MARGIILYLSVLVLWLFAAGNALAATEVSGVYFATKGDGTVATFTMDGSITRHKITAEENPDRLVIDVVNGVWDVPGDSAIGKSALVKDIRSGNPQPGLLRIVISLHNKVEIISDNRTSTTLSVQFASVGKSSPSKNTTAEKIPVDSTKKPSSETPQKGYVPSFMKGKGAAKKDSAPSSTGTSSGRKPVIVIDPGHGGMDPGATGKSGIYEKKITLQYAITLKKLLEKSGTYKVYLTRTDDRYIDLGDRVKKARKWKGDLFISLHADSHENSDTRGLSVYTISEDRAERETDKLVDKAGKTEVIRGVDMKGEDKEVQGALLDLARRANTNTAATFAELLVAKMGNNAQLLDNTHRQKSLAVLTDIDITSVLIELGYLSNRHEEKKLRTDDYRKKLTGGIKNAIDSYFKKFPLQD